jgi:hypothetical protein
MMKRVRKPAGESGTSFKPQQSRFASRPFASKAEEPEAPVGESRVSFSLADIDIFPRETVQPKLVLGPVGDRYEQEADAVSSQGGFGHNALAAEREQVKPVPNRTGMPDRLKAGIESLSGLSMDDVNVEYNSAKPAQINALAYTQGLEIHVAPGQERHLPHECWHAVQQMQGRVKPTMQMTGGVSVNDDAGLELEADILGSRAARLMLGRGQFMSQKEAEAQRQAEVMNVLRDTGEPAEASREHVHQKIMIPCLAATQRMESGDGVIQMNGYTLSDASDPKAIKEKEVGTGQIIQFTTFTSCIGVIGKKSDGTLVGIHLVRVGADDKAFQKNDVPTVKARLSGLSNITIIGQTDFWEGELLDEIGGSIVGGTDDGSFSATTDKDGKIVITKKS